MLEGLFEAIFWITISIVFIGCGFFVLCLIAERFIIVTIPVVADLYFRWKYPHEYEKEINNS